MTRPSRFALCLAAAALTALPAVAATAQTSAPATPTRAADLPDGREVIAKSVEAMGGKKAYSEIKSTYLKGAMVAGPQTIDVEAYTSGKDKFFSQRTIAQMGLSFSAGKNGDIRWMQPPMGELRLASEAEIERSRGEAAMPLAIFTMLERYGKIETVGREDIDGLPTYKVRLAERKDVTDPLAATEAHVFIDAKTSLPVAFEMTDARGRNRSRFVMSEWKKFGDFQLFTKMVTEQQGRPIVVTFEKFEFNKVDDVIFTPPSSLPTPPAAPATPPTTGGGTGG